MSEEVKRYDERRGTVVVIKKEILGKTYIVTVWPPKEGEQKVIIYADTTNGDDIPFPDELVDLYTGEEKIARGKIDISENKSPQIARIVNKAVVTLEEYLEDTASTEDAVIGALDANKEVHES